MSRLCPLFPCPSHICPLQQLDDCPQKVRGSGCEEYGGVVRPAWPVVKRCHKTWSGTAPCHRPRLCVGTRVMSYTEAKKKEKEIKKKKKEKRKEKKRKKEKKNAKKIKAAKKKKIDK